MGDPDLSGAAARLAHDGHVTVRGLLDPGEVEGFRRIVGGAVAKADKLVLSDENDVYQQAFDQYMNLWKVNDAVSRITLNPRLGQVAAALLGVPAVRLYHDQALIKVGGGGHTPWHQDQWYWPLDTDRTVTMWLPLHDTTEEMGDLCFAIGTNQGPIGDAPISEDSDRFYDDYLAANGVALSRTGAMAAGDASFHLGWTLHSAGPNTTALNREVMTVIWFADGARAVRPANSGQADDLQRWLPGVAPGELAASAINPVCG